MAKILQKRQWAKYLSSDFIIKIRNSNPESPLRKSYLNSYYCSHNLMTREKKLVTTYCKNRWCLVCNRIRTAVLINSYKPELDNLNQLFFVTLTLPTCTAEELPNQINRMGKAWRTIYLNSKNAGYTKKGHPPLRGVRKCECTIRPAGKYHYHFHVLVNNWSCAEWLISQWLRKFPEADPKAQDSRVADSKSYLELFKYFTKITTKSMPKANYIRLDIIFQALRGKKVFQSFGIKPKKDDFDDEDLIATIDTVLLDDQLFRWEKDDWYGLESGSGLVGIPIPKKVEEMIKKHL
jgi:hypothetical protein